MIDEIITGADECGWDLDPSAVVRLSERKPVSAFGAHRIEGVVRPQADPDDNFGLLMACMKRVTPQMPDYEDRGLEVFARRFFKEFIPVMYDEDIMSFDEYLDTLDKPARFKEQLKEAHLNRRRDYDIRDTRITSSFVKDEDYDEFKCPRGIQGISKESVRGDLNGYYGRIIKSMERVIYDSCPGLIKHLKPEERMALIGQLGSHSFASANDYSSYEATFTLDRMEAVQLQLYEHVLAGVSNGGALLSGIRNVITGMNKLKFRRAGLTFYCNARKMSGDPDTALSNALDNLVCISYLLSKLKVPPAEAVKMFYVEGDDNIGVYGSHTLKKEDFSPLGLKAKPITPTSALTVTEVGFCQLYGSGEVICTNPWKKLAKCGRVAAKYIGASDKVFDSLLRAEALSMLSLHHGAPVVSVLAAQLLKITRGVNVREHHWSEVKRWGVETPRDVKWRDLSTQPIRVEDRILVEQSFGMTVDMQLRIEGIIRSWKGGPLLLPTEWFPADWTLFADRYVTHKLIPGDSWLQAPSREVVEGLAKVETKNLKELVVQRNKRRIARGGRKIPQRR